MTDSRLEYLLEKYLAKTCTEMEKKELAGMILATGNEAGIQAFLEQAWDTAKTDEDMPAQKADQLFHSILQQGGKKDIAIVRRMFGWKKMAVAASILIAIAMVGYFIIPRSNSHTELVSRSSKDFEPPQSTKAIITLADGRTIALDSLTIITQGKVSVVKNVKGEIVYESKGNGQQSTIQYNTLSNPRGSQVATITLADGSKVWLNAGSSITYPIVFTGPERKVSITGEAYFEVAKNAARPFIISTGETRVKVLGTSFNVNAYADETGTRVTLVEGSVDVSKNRVSKILKPGQQALINDDIQVHSSFAMEDVLAWKNGRFAFDGSDIQQVMRELARWYDLEVVYTKNVKEKFHVELTRNTNLSNVFKILEETGGVHFKIDGKKILVMP